MAKRTSSTRSSQAQPGTESAERGSESSSSSQNGRGSHRGESVNESKRQRSGGGNRRQRERRVEREQEMEAARIIGSQAGGQSRGRSSRSGNVLLDAGSAVVESVRQHPVPAALIGAGLAWLILESRAAREAEMRLLEQARSAASRVGEAFSGIADTAREAYSEASEATQETLSSAAESVRDRAASLAEYAQTGAASVGSALQTGAKAVGETAQTGYERSREAIADAWEQHPLAVGASLLAAGVATGLMLPSSVREGNLIGSAAKNVTEKVRSKSTELIEQGRELVSSSAEALTREAKRYGISAGSGGRSSGRKR